MSNKNISREARNRARVLSAALGKQVKRNSETVNSMIVCASGKYDCDQIKRFAEAADGRVFASVSLHGGGVMVRAIFSRVSFEGFIDVWNKSRDLEIYSHQPTQ